MQQNCSMNRQAVEMRNMFQSLAKALKLTSNVWGGILTEEAQTLDK